MVWRPGVAYGTILVLAAQKGKPGAQGFGPALERDHGWADWHPQAANERTSAQRRGNSKTRRRILSDYNKWLPCEACAEKQASAKLLLLGLWVRHRSGRRTSAWFSFSEATIPSRAADEGRCPSRWKESRRVADLR